MDMDNGRGYGDRIRDIPNQVANGIYNMPDGGKLAVSLLLDAIGYIPVGPLDPLVGGAQGTWIKLAYDDAGMGLGAFVEETLPGTDFIPTCTLAHIRHVRNRKREYELEG